ncbi:MAG TPA: HAMP domain-containing sensor histidine kinase [Hyphomicrobiales bacterium]|mgnify:CR=1 FL=1|nr:HAMP domain-containing sensor histidine kinase [Hyphomicrobiales bacterium]
MKLITLVKSYLLVMLALSMASVLLTIWSVRSSAINNELLELAHESYELHLTVSADTYLLFKRYGDLLLGGTADREAENEQLVATLQNTLSGLRQVIGKEIELVGERQLEELARVDKIEKVIGDLVARFRQAQQTPERGDIRENWRDLGTILITDLKQDFRALIAEALADEHEQVAAAEASESAAHLLARRISILLGATFLLVSVGAGIVFQRRLTRPLDKLMAGVNGFAAGNFDTAIDLKGRDELSEIGTLLDRMAGVVLKQSKDLIQRNEQLELAVKARTKELENMLAREQESKEDRRQLLADVSHELRTPLTVIQGESEVALRGAEKDPEDYREALRRIRDATVHTATLVNDLLFIARSEMGRVRLRLARFDLVELLREVAGLSGQVDLVQSALSSAPIEADRQRLRQAVLALAHNVHHHGGDLTAIRLERTPDGYVIAVEDDGPGLADADRERVFERFYRGPNASEVYVDGLGLGLPIVRSIAEAHGGKAWIVEREGGGMSARIGIPDAPAAEGTR